MTSSKRRALRLRRFGARQKAFGPALVLRALEELRERRLQADSDGLRKIIDERLERGIGAARRNARAGAEHEQAIHIRDAYSAVANIGDRRGVEE